MAISGGFAGGLAQGLRNGMMMNDYLDEREKRAKDEAVNEAMARAAQGAPDAGLSDVALERPAGGVGEAAGLAPVDASAPAQAPAGGGVALVDLAGSGAPGGAPAAAGMPSGARGPGLSTVQDDTQNFTSALSGLNAGIAEAWKQKRPDRALDLMIQRERIAGVRRNQGYDQALARYQMTNDPNAFVEFANNYLTTGLQIEGLDRAAESENGTPIYTLRGTDQRTGRPFTRAVSGPQFESFVRGIADPATQRAMFVDQANKTYQESQAQRDHQFKLNEIEARGEQDRKTNAAKGTIDGRTAAPAEIRTPEWLLDRGVAKDESEAWDMVRGARTKSRQEFALDFAKSILTNQRNAFPDDQISPQQAMQQGLDLYDSIGTDRQESNEQNAGAPAVGAVEDGYRFKGGDPADPNSWEQL